MGAPDGSSPAAPPAPPARWALPPPTGSGRWPRWCLPALAGLAALPFAVAVASLVGRSWVPASDHALISLRVSDVGGEHTPLVGLGSRGRWSHLGPWMFWLLAPFRWVFGPMGMLAGTAVLHAVAATATVVVGWRRGGLRLAALLALAIVLLANALGISFLVDPWNPSMPFFAFLLFLVLVWAVVCDDAAMLPAAVVAGSLAVQSHASYLPLVGTLALVAAGWTAAAARRKADPARRRWSALAGVAVVVLWAPPVIEQLTADPGNLTLFSEFLREPGEPAGGLDDALGFFGVQFRPWGAWVTGDDVAGLGSADRASSIPAFATLAALAAASWWARRRGERPAARLGLVAVAAAVTGIAASARITGLPVPYLLRWWWAVAAVGTVALIHGLVAGSGDERADRAVTAAAGAGALAVAALVVAQAPAEVPLPELSEGLAAVAPATVEGLEADGRYVVRGIDTASFGGSVHGLFAELERRGVDVRSDHLEGAALGYGEWRLVPPGEVGALDGVVTIIARSDHDAGATPADGSELLASYDPLSPAERDRFSELADSIRADIGDGAPPGRIEVTLEAFRLEAVRLGASADEVDELRRLVERGEGYLVYLTDP